ncbi:MAG TPA: multicopper oxidase [Acidimicrobiales bacterium]|nr:multicopper oxidase [Acidimicrobiales bacterium]
MGTSGLSRRDFLRIGGGAGAGLFFVGRIGGRRFRLPVAGAQVPEGMLDPGDVPKYQTPLLIPPVMPRAATVIAPGGKPVDYYEISMRQFAQQILPAGLPMTTVWGYGAVAAQSRSGLLIHNAPSLTIEARFDRPVRVKWINELVDGSGNFLPHLLPVDPTLHWANPPGGTGGRDSRPTFTETPDPYTGPVPIVTHVHGAVGVGDESDGYAEAWYLPAAADIDADFATEGTWYGFFAAKAAASYGAAWGPGFATFQYPNLSRASTIWYHDHALGMTRLNVYAGPAGFFIVRGGPAGDATVLDSRTGLTASLPGPAPRENDKFPPNKSYREIPIAIQDRSFTAGGSRLFYPDTREFFDEYEGPYIPVTDISPIWNPEFFGNTIMVNGNTWPFLTVEKRRYRFRVLNGCQSRFLILDFNDVPEVDVWAIGNEGGFLAAPVSLTAGFGNRLLMGLAERADLIVDFTNVPVGSYVLANVGPDEPFGGGQPGVDFDPADPGSTGQILEFRVVPAVGVDEGGNKVEGPTEALLGTVANGTWFERKWMDAVTENPTVGDTEVWELYNTTADAHPMHIHEVAFEVVNRQEIVILEESEEVQVAPGSVPVAPEPWETGVKDTVIAYPGQVTRVRIRFDNRGQFVWHCHIVEHEDNEMMRPYRIGPAQPGQPDPV